MLRPLGPYRAPLGGSRLRSVLPRGRAEIAGGLAAAASGLAVVHGWWLAAAGLIVVGMVTVWIALRPRAAVFLFLAALPFFVYVASFGSISLFLGVPVAFFLSLALLAAAAERRTVAQPKLPVAAWGLLVAFAAVSAAASTRPIAAETRVVYLLVFGLFAWGLAQALARGVLTHLAVVQAIVVSACVGAVAVTTQFVAQFLVGDGNVTSWLLGLERSFAGERAAAGKLVQQSNWSISDPLIFGRDLVRGIFPFMSPPSSGQFLMLGFVATLWLALDRSSKRSPRAFYASRLAVVLVGIGLIATYSRQSWLGALVGIAAMPLARRRWDLLVAAALVLVVLAFVPIPGHGSLAGNLTGAQTTTYYGSYRERLQIWSAVPNDISKSPLVGVGPGQYSTLHELEPGTVYYGHNLLFDSAVELGLIGAALLIALFASAVRTAGARSPGLALPMLVAWVVANMFDDTLYFPRNGYLLAATIALGSVAMRSEEQLPRRQRVAAVPLGARL